MSESIKQKQRTVFIGFAIGAIAMVPMTTSYIFSNYSFTILVAVLGTAADTVVSFLSWLTLRKASKGKTFEYNYGYGKWENLISLTMAGVMFISVGFVLYGAMVRLFIEPSYIKPTGVIIAICISIAAIIINISLWRKNYALAQIEPSPIMESQWRLFRAKVMNSACSLSSYALSLIFLSYSWSFVFDPIFSILLTIFLGYSAYGLFTNSVYDLLDRTLDETLQLVILKQLASYYDEYTQFHGVTSRRAGGKIYIELFLEFDGTRTMAAVQKVIEDIRTALEGEIKYSRVTIAPVTAPIG